LGKRNVILTDISLRSNSSVWVFDASNLSFLREDHFDNPMQVRFASLESGPGNRSQACTGSWRVALTPVRPSRFPHSPPAGWRSCAGYAEFRNMPNGRAIAAA
jgi:hypothetical protein